MTRSHLLFLCVVCGLAAGCGEEGNDTSLPLPPYADFQNTPYAVLLRDCGFPACHGTDERFFRVYGPGRLRLSGSLETEATGQPTLDEISQTHLSAGAMIDPDDLDNSPLLRKPLSVAAGGSGHQGVDGFGRDVYRSKEAAGYLVLREWIRMLQPAAPAAPVAP